MKTKGTSNIRRRIRRLAGLFLLATLAPAHAAEFFVGPGHYDTVQEAVDAAADPANLAADNYVSIQSPLVQTTAGIVVGNAFNDAHRLVIRPDPAQPGLRRVTIAAQHGFTPILAISNAASVTVQDLDLIRHFTNFDDLVRLDHCTNVVVQRCRIGSDWPTAGTQTAANLRIIQPKLNVIRNCLCFSAVAGHFERGISVDMASAMNRSVLLYNNVVADYDGDGIFLNADGDCFAVLRNNVVVNRATLIPEADAIHSVVTPLVTIESSHNAVFATPAHVEEQSGVQAVQGTDLLRFDPVQVGAAFHKFEWVTSPAWDPNHGFFRLMDGGVLRHDGIDAGARIAAAHPGARDVAVTDDWERDPRPNTDDERTDRGADQVPELTVADLRVVLPGIPSVTGVSLGGSGSNQFEIVAVGPQEDLPEFGTAMMSGGEFRLSGRFRSLALAASGPPVLPAATRFDGSPLAFIEWPADARYDPTVAMTVEAWVWRENASRTEAILAHGAPDSFWFGFAGARLLFVRSGGARATSVANVPARRWTHVAAAYDGSQVEFFIDGKSAGVRSLANAGSGRFGALRLGGDGAGANFQGRLDEVRIWNTRRLGDEIRQTMFTPASPIPSLVALFPSGGAWEAIAGVPGQPGAGVFPEPIGIIRPNLEIPRGWFRMTLDGDIHPWSEYLGAAQVPIRYDADDGVPDAIASFIYRDRTYDRNLYIGVTGLRDVPFGRERSNSWVAVTVDADWSREAAPRFGDFEIRGFMDKRPAELWLADNQGNWVNSGFLPGGTWDVQYTSPDEFGPPQMEFRIGREWLTWPPEPADWTGTDGLLIGHYHVEANGDSYLAPTGAHLNEPVSWVPATYVANTNQPVHVTMTGHVYDNDNAHPMANHPVDLRDDVTGELLITDTTDAHGYVSFNNVYVPPNRNLRLEVGTAANLLHLPTEVADTDLQPVEPRNLSVLPRQVVFPPPSVDSNHCAAVTFTLRQPIGEMGLTRYDPIEGVPRLRLRDTPEKLIPSNQATRVRIFGTNIHQGIQVFLYSCLNLPPENLANAGDCVLNEDYFEARIVGRADDDSWVRVEVPHVPRRVFDSPWAKTYGWAIKDNWLRPARGDEWRRLGGFVGTNFSLQLPPYALVSGFEFDNERFDADWEDFAGVFRENAYIAGDCLRDPGYQVFFPIFEFLNQQSGGSCNGMAATSLQFHRLELDAEDDALLFLPGDDDTDGVHFAAGFTRQGRAYYIDRNCEPYRPKNLRAHIRVNHGVQFSAEYVQTLLDQMVGGWFSIEGDPALVLDRVRNDPGGYVISMIPEIGSGHVVTPYAVVDGVTGDDEPDPESAKILVYDNNHPEDTDRFIEITVRPDRSSYRFPRASDIVNQTNRWEGRWSGQGIYAVPIEVFTEPHTMPGLEEIAEMLRILVFGGADAHCTNSAGGEWGWRADGTLVDHLQGARSITPIGGPNSSTRSVMLVVPTTNPPPDIEINVRSNRYSFLAGGGGHVFNLDRRDGISGDLDQLRLALTNGRLDTIRYRPQHPAGNFDTRLIQTSGPKQRAVFEWSGLSVGAGGAVEFRNLPGSRGVELRNDSNVPAHYLLTVSWSDGMTTNQGVSHFGPFEVAVGASQQVFIQNWPLVTQVRSELDLNRDGTPEQINLMDAADLPPLPLHAVLVAGNIVLSWPVTSYPVIVETSPSLTGLVRWTPMVVQPEVAGQTLRATLPAGDAQRFFRLSY